MKYIKTKYYFIRCFRICWIPN